MNLQPHIFCATINFQKLDKVSDEVLLRANLNNDTLTIDAIKKSIGFPVSQVAVIKKCNAVMIVITYFSNYAYDFIRGRLLSTWDEVLPEGLDGNAYRYIKCYEGDKALKYLCESALGVHSVTPGDSQVLSQVCEALYEADEVQNVRFSMLKVTVKWIKEVALEARRNTELYAGNTSLERIATEIIDKNKKTKVTVIGAGRTGRLITKILAQELGFSLKVTNRSEEKAVALAKKYPKTESIKFHDFNSLVNTDYIVIALERNSQTQEYIEKLFERIEESIVIDLSSPSITSEIPNTKDVPLYDVEYLSEVGKTVILRRKAELDKVRAIISKSVPHVSMRIEKEFGAFTTNEHKKKKVVKLDDHTLEILKIRDVAIRSIRNFYFKNDFVEVSTPCIVGVSTDPPKVDNGGIFSIEWPNGGSAFLRQSNQLYKQMIVASGVPKIYEIGPFWRLEESSSYRHLLESVGLDVEVSNPESLELLYKMAYETIKTAFNTVNKELNILNANLKLPSSKKVPVMRYSEAIEVLQSRGFNIKYGEDLGLIGEAKLGYITKKEKMSDALIIINYPDTVKKFYTKKKNNGETETFDVLIDGWELVSGAIRNTDRKDIEKSMRLSGINTLDYTFYLSLIDNADSHGGFCLGIDRLIAKILDKEMVVDATPFPRTADKLIP
jgi:nondiscriminating aspartyl-tRNA synthetase